MSAVILVCAATGTEARAAARGIARAPGGSRGFEVLETGMGPDAATRALARRLADQARPRPAGVVSTGFAGSRSPSLALGAVVVATSVARAGHATIALGDVVYARLAAGGLACVPARFASVDGVVVGDRVALPDAPIDAVDMESHAWAVLARAHGLPIAVVRVISDTIEKPVPAAIVRFTGAGPALGRIAGGIGSALARPVELAGFVARAARLTGVITTCWSACAPLLGLPWDA